MKTSHAVGLLVGLGLGAIGGIAAAARRKKEEVPEGPFFLYRVQAGDTLSALALTFFGDAALVPLLTLWNNDVQRSVDALPAGGVLRIPCERVTVQKGETLATIAARVLGDAGRWRRIYAANKAALPDPNKLAVGQRLVVPVEKSPPVNVSVGCGLAYLGVGYLSEDLLGRGGRGGGGGGGRGGGRGRGHGHGHGHGRGRRWGGGPWPMPVYYGTDPFTYVPDVVVVEDDDDDGPTAEEVAEEVVRRLKHKAR